MEKQDNLDSSRLFYEDLIKSIAQPEPMCLLIAKFRVTDIKASEALEPATRLQIPTAVATAIQDRLEKNLREYDLLSKIESNVFVAALKTLIDESELEKRLIQIEKTLQQSYFFQEIEAVVEVEIGSAMRKPGETPSNLLKRADAKIKNFFSLQEQIS